MRTGRSLLSMRLRVESIRLLSATLALPELQPPQQQQQAAHAVGTTNGAASAAANAAALRELKEKAVQVFFRSLLSRSKEIVEVARTGLRGVTEREKIPKELLQQVHSILSVLVPLPPFSLSVLLPLSMFDGVVTHLAASSVCARCC